MHGTLRRNDMARGIRIYENAGYGDSPMMVRFHIFGVVPTSLAVMQNGDVMVWSMNCEDACKEPRHGWRLVWKGDAS